MPMDYSLTLVAGWNNLNTLLVAASYGGHKLMSTVGLKNTDATETIAIQRDSLAAPSTDSGFHLAPGQTEILDTVNGIPVDITRTWIRTSAGVSSVVDISLVPRI